MWKQLKKSCHTKKRISLVITYDIIWHNMTQPYEMVRPLPRVSGALISILRDALRNLRNFGNPEIFSRKMGETMPGMPQGCHMIHWNILKLSTNVGKSGAISHWPIDRLRARSSESPLAHVSIAHHGQNEVTTRFSLTHFLISKPNSLCWLIRLSHVITSLSHFRIHQGTSYLSPSHRLAQGEELHEGLAQRVSHAAAPRRQLVVDPLTTGAQVLWHRLRRNRFCRWISRSYRPPQKKKTSLHSTCYTQRRACLCTYDTNAYQHRDRCTIWKVLHPQMQTDQ
jgi:hypothetical protein